MVRIRALCLHSGCSGSAAAADGVSWATDGSVVLDLTTPPRCPIAIAPFAGTTAASATQSVLWVVGCNLQTDVHQLTWSNSSRDSRVAGSRRGCPSVTAGRSLKARQPTLFVSYPGVCMAPATGNDADGMRLPQRALVHASAGVSACQRSAPPAGRSVSQVSDKTFLSETDTEEKAAGMPDCIIAGFSDADIKAVQTPGQRWC